MTEPKKEKCEACYGSGYINFRTDDGHISMRTCRRCNGYGYINVEPLTNEEWRRTCSAEEFAKWLVEVTEYCFECGLNINNNVLCPFKKCIDKECDGLDWLKEEHHEV